MKKNVIMAIVVFFIFLSVFLYFKKENKNEEILNSDIVRSDVHNLLDKEVVENKKEDKLTYSRISFFHTKPVYASFSIPSNWEGKYRMKERGNIVSFIYIEDDKGVPIFSVKLLPENTQDNEVGSRKIANKYGYDLILLGSEEIEMVDDFHKMQDNVKKIVESIKIFKM